MKAETISNLQKARQHAGLSQSELAGLSDINVRVLQNYEQGIRDIEGAKLATLLKICRALKCSLSTIMPTGETQALLREYGEQ